MVVLFCFHCSIAYAIDFHEESGLVFLQSDFLKVELYCSSLSLHNYINQKDCRKMQCQNDTQKTYRMFTVTTFSSSLLAIEILLIHFVFSLLIAIALAHQQIEATVLVNAVEDADASMLSSDFLSTIENFLPDPKEVSLFPFSRQ